MATAITVQVAEGPFETAGAGDLDYTYAASDVTGNTIAASGGNIVILLSNTQAGAQTFTLTSVADEDNRTGDITNYSMAAADFVVLTQGLTTTSGWLSAAGLITITTSHADILIAALQIPN